MTSAQTDRALLVPMSLEAIVVSGETQQAVNLAPRFQLFGRPRVPKLGRSLRAEPWDAQTGALTLNEGVHLHWALPSALTHGIQMPDEQLEFPPVPNRWLVLRLAMTEQSQSAAWVLHSDALDSQNGTNDFLAQTDDGPYFRTRIGRFYRYGEKWDEQPQQQLQRLTAVGPGNPGFAAFYPGCRNVFGFHDDLKGVGTGAFLYLVAGWYDRQEDDPLNPANTLSNREEWLRHFRDRWWKDKKTTPPAKTLCHGTLHSVTWDRSKESKLPQEAPYRIAVGNTAIEALSALLAQSTKQGRLVEPLLSAFQYEMLANADRPFGMPELDGELHGRRFFPVDGGTQWRLQPVERRSGAGLNEAPAKPPFPTDPEVATIFDRLCDAQHDCDHLARELSSLRGQYYAAWFQSKLPSPPTNLQKVMESCKTQIEKTRAKLQEARLNIEGDPNIEGRLRQLAAKGIRIASLPPGMEAGGFAPPVSRQPDYELVAAPLPSFWRATDPAILLARPGNPAAHRYAGRPETPACRVVEDLLKGLTVTLPLGGQTRPVNVDAETKWDFPLEQRAASSLPYEEVKALCHESFLLDPGRAEALAVKAFALAAQTLDRSSPLIQALAPQIRTFQQELKLIDGQEVRSFPEKSVLPIQAVSKWDGAFHPLFMVWELEWAPTYEQAGGWSPDGKWELMDNTEYRWGGDAPPDTLQAARKYYGWAPLSLSLSRQLQARLKDAPDIARPFANWSFLTQSANGLTNMLIQQEETLQLPPLLDDGTIDMPVWNLLGHAIRWSPLREDLSRKSGFFPIRAGHFRLTRLWLVDAFGRTDKALDPGKDRNALPSVVPAASLRAAEGPQPSWITLPPRIVQPARLRCRWTSVADERKGRCRESSANPATSPLLGWVVPNHFDHGLLVCDATGKVRGELRVVQRGERRLVWASVPGSSASAGGEPSLDGDPHLEQFVQGLKSAGSSVLDDLLKLVDRISLGLTTPATRRIGTLSVLLGHPLALVRAALDLELGGRPAADPPWADPPEASGLRTTGFPVRIGDGRRSDDGLIGYFAGTDYSRMRLPFAAPAPDQLTSKNYFVVNDPLELMPDAEAVTVTLLMDPRAGVHCACGILPAQVVELSEEVVERVLSRIEVSFRVGPVLGMPESFRLPVPGDVEGSWSWFDFDRSRSEPKQWQENPDVGIAETGAFVPAELAQVQAYDGWLTIRKTEQK